jgi:hypothetical protein
MELHGSGSGQTAAENPELSRCFISIGFLISVFTVVFFLQSMGLTGGTRALIILAVLGATALFGWFLCWWFREGLFRHRAGAMANAGYGHHLDEGGAGHPRPPVGHERPPMGRI